MERRNVNDAHVALLARALETERPEEERWRYAYKALRMLCDDVVMIHESRTNQLTAMQRAVAVVDEACERFGFHRTERQHLIELAMWAEAKTKIAPFQQIDDVLRMVESLAEQRARHVEPVVTPVVVDNPPVMAEYVVAELPVSGRNVGFYQLAKCAMEDLSDTPEPEAMRLVRRARRRLVTKKKLLTATEFRRRAQISSEQLRARARHNAIFAICQGRITYYPALFLRVNRPQFRLARVVRAMSGMDDPWGKYLELVYRFESLGGKTLPQILRRGSGLHAAMRYARALAGH